MNERAARAHARQDRSRCWTASLAGKTIGVLGLSFKPETDDMRDCAGRSIIAAGLLERGAKVQAYDPASDGVRAGQASFPTVALCKDAYAACEGRTRLVIVTEWNQFRMLDLERIKSELLRSPVMVDLRNIYDPGPMRDAGFTYVRVRGTLSRGRICRAVAATL